MNLHPTKCNLCGEKVIFTSNARIYGKEYGSGKCYLCTSCWAYVGTHKPRPDEAMGILADAEMRQMKMKCHELFDKRWMAERNRRKARNKEYEALANYLGIPVEECHFGYFDMDMLNKAYDYLRLESESDER